MIKEGCNPMCKDCASFQPKRWVTVNNGDNGHNGHSLIVDFGKSIIHKTLGISV